MYRENLHDSKKGRCLPIHPDNSLLRRYAALYTTAHIRDLNYPFTGWAGKTYGKTIEVGLSLYFVNPSTDKSTTQSHHGISKFAYTREEPIGVCVSTQMLLTDPSR